jgi:hypothetical protein
MLPVILPRMGGGEEESLGFVDIKVNNQMTKARRP